MSDGEPADSRDHERLLADLLGATSGGAEDEDGIYRLRVRSARQIMELPDPPASFQLLGPFAFRGYRTIIVGDTGHGKTTFALQMLSSILTGDEMLGFEGAGVGPIMIVDLEQGIRSIKRGIVESKLEGRDDALWITVPDGLALDQEPQHFAALDQAIDDHQPVAVLLDPYYKAHRAEDPNAERPIIDLMRALDSLRVRHGFALVLPAHPRKDQQRDGGARKLTLHDIAGSGAATRGAEIVLAVERLSHGYARLRFLKDRDGDLEIGEHLPLLYDKERGYRLDSKSMITPEGIEEAILGTTFGWATAKEWAKHLNVREDRLREVLKRLVERDDRPVVTMVGPPGRSRKAVAYSTDPGHRDQSGSVLQLEGLRSTDPSDPTSIREVDHGITQSPSLTDPGSVGSVGAVEEKPNPFLEG